MIRPLQSLRWRLQLWHALILFAVIGVLCVLAYRIVREERMSRIRRELGDFDRALMTQVVFKDRNGKGAPPSQEVVQERLSDLKAEPGMPAEFLALFDSISTGKPYFGGWDAKGKPLFISPNAPAGLRPPESERGPDGGRFQRSGPHLLFAHRSPQGFTTVSGRDLSSDLAGLKRLAWLLGASGGGLWLLGLAGGWWIAGRAIQPIGAIAHTASRIASGEISDRVKPPGTDDELAELAEVLNRTFDRLEGMIRQQKQFIADASHELRTPVTVILSEVQRGLRRERDPESYREILTTTGRAGERMRSLIESLLALARQDFADLSPVRETCDLGGIVKESCALLRGVAEESGASLWVSADNVEIEGEKLGLTMMITNLVGNAIEHTPAGSQISVRLEKGRDIRLTVMDDGPGISHEHLAHVFERFYRVDAARGSDGHSGLGLAIVKAVAERHGGTVEVVSSPGKGSEFIVRLPR